MIDRLRNGELIERYFKVDAIDRIITDIRYNRINSYHVANAVWTIFALQLWYDNIKRK